MKIQLLNDELINKIAAGEVIEKPASIVKELVENSFDAKSTILNINIIGGGIEKIEIEDNGEGMTAEDIPLAFQRHATSKIRKEEDLENIYTMGFRGEALPSIASVSRIEIQSKTSANHGIKALIEGGKISDINPYHSPQGTKIVVKDLFFNTPARKNFLKSPVSENISIHDMVSKLALSRPDISISFSNEKRRYYKTPGNKSLFDTIASIYGHDFIKNFIEIRHAGELYSLRGFVSPTDVSKTNRKNQIFFVNNRIIRSPLFYRAIDEAYKGFLLHREYPQLFLFFECVASDIDINVHPQKSEVRFKDERRVFSFIKSVVREAINKNSVYLTDKNFSFLNQKEKLNEKKSSLNAHNFIQDSMLNYNSNNTDKGHNTNVVLLKQAHYPELSSEYNEISEEKNHSFFYKIIGQCFNTYILLENEEELLIIDQHAAHERIIYEKILSSQINNDEPQQSLAFPLSIELSVDKIDLINKEQSLFKDLGFDLDIISYNSLVIRATPLIIKGNEIAVLEEIIDLLSDKQNINLNNEAYIIMACKKAVKAGDILSSNEISNIIDDLFKLEDYMHCPHGRPTITKIRKNELNQKFKR